MRNLPPEAFLSFLVSGVPSSSICTWLKLEHTLFDVPPYVPPSHQISPLRPGLFFPDTFSRTWPCFLFRCAAHAVFFSSTNLGFLMSEAMEPV